MKASVIREMSLTEIRERIDTEKSAYQKLKMNHVVSSLENPLKLKFARKAIARLSTELTKRESADNTDTVQAEAPAKASAKATEDAVAKDEVKDEKTVEEIVETEKTDEKAQA